MKKPVQPTKPEEYSTISKFEVISYYELKYHEYGSELLKLSDIQFPKDIKIENLYLRLEQHYSDSNIEVSLVQEKKEIIKNKKFHKEMEVYEKKLAKYQEDMKKFQSIEQTNLEKQLQEAQELLKKHGKL